MQNDVKQGVIPILGGYTWLSTYHSPTETLKHPYFSEGSFPTPNSWQGRHVNLGW